MKKILVFGGSGGIGSELFKSFLHNKYDFNSLSSKDVDITDFNLVEKTIIAHEPDLVVNLAAVNIDALLKNPASSGDAEKQIRVNALGAYNILNNALSYFVESGKSGKVIMVSSFLSKRPVKGAGVYSATKAFVDNLVKTAAMENAKYGITVNSIQCGFFDAGLTNKLPETVKNLLPMRIPLGRLGKVEELGHAIKFLFENDYVTGTNLVIDGGVSLV